MRKIEEIKNLAIGFLLSGILIGFCCIIIHPIETFSDFTKGLMFAGLAFMIAEALEKRKKQKKQKKP